MRFTYLTNKANTNIFKLLVRFPHPLCLRDVAYLSKQSLRSTQIALDNLCKLKVVRKKREANKIMYSIIESPIIKIYRAIFEEETKEDIIRTSQSYVKKSKSLLQSLQDLIELSQVINSIKAKQQLS